MGVEIVTSEELRDALQTSQREQLMQIKTFVEVAVGKDDRYYRQILEAIEYLKDEILNIKALHDPDKVVQTFERNEETKKVMKTLETLKSELHRVVVENIRKRSPLCIRNERGVTHFTQEGESVYSAWSKYTAHASKTLGVKREYFTNGKYARFFDNIGKPRLRKSTAFGVDGKQHHAVWTSIIASGLAEEYTTYLLKLTEERREVIG